jgi:hypothetical protein
MKAFLSILAMLTIAPLVATTTSVCLQPEPGSLDPLAIVMMALVGVLIGPLWPTYIPALIATPLLMRWMSARPAFRRSPLPLVLGLSIIAGVVAGICVMVPLILLELRDSSGDAAAVAAASAGATSGGVTLALICLLYRYEKPRPEHSTPPNGGPATQRGNSRVTGGPPPVS